MNLFETVTEEINPLILQDETPISFLRQAQELVRYYYAPGMHAVRFETLLDQLGAKADKIEKARLEDVGAKPH